VMAWSTGQGAIRDQVIRAARPKNSSTPRQTHCNVGYGHMKRYRPGYGRDRERNPNNTDGVWAPNDKWK
jgi:hypothetical protein